jgi:hypothetical protein
VGLTQLKVDRLSLVSDKPFATGLLQFELELDSLI